MSQKDKINIEQLPKHIAIIMDGNGRWAKRKNMPRIFGHQNGVQSVREAAESAAELGVSYLTLYAFSTENWNRPIMEVDALMDLLVQTIKKEVVTLHKNNIRLNAIGDLKSLPSKTYQALMEAIEDTKDHDRMVLTLALSYSSRWEIIETTRKIAELVQQGKCKPEDITQDFFSQHLATAGMPDPELLIRTSGEERISNFLLWQIAYSELYFTKKYWPEFKKEDMYEAIIHYQKRERRFGKTSEQIK